MRTFAEVILLKKIANISIALVLLVATTGVTLNKHYCMGRLKAVALFQSANTCADEGMTDPMPCCEDVSEELKVENLTKASFDFKSSPELVQLAAFQHAFLVVIISNKKERPSFQNYSPPPSDRDIPVLIQSFLI